MLSLWEAVSVPGNQPLHSEDPWTQHLGPLDPLGVVESDGPGLLPVSPSLPWVTHSLTIAPSPSPEEPVSGEAGGVATHVMC